MPATSTSDLDRRVGAVRRFNRLYTQRIGVLQDGLPADPLFAGRSARALRAFPPRKSDGNGDCDELGLDHGYLSRILRAFGERGLVVKTASPNDRRQSLLSLTAKGRMAFAPLDQARRKRSPA